MDSSSLKDTVSQLLAQQKDNLKTAKQDRKRFKGDVSQRELELAVTVLLVDLAASDQDFDPTEYQVIVHGLMRLFGTKKHEVSALVNQAQTALRNMRGIGRFGATIKDNLSVEERLKIMEVIEDVIGADGIEDDYETYLREKLRDLLGLEDEDDI